MKDKFFLFCVLCIFCASLKAATATIDGITWRYTVSNGEAILGDRSSSGTAVSKSTSGALTIPSSLGGYPVTRIWDYAFYNCSGLTSVTMPDSVTSIGYRAFEDCRGLTSVTIGNGVTSIGQSAFYNCSGLTSITIPDGVTSIKLCAFYNCSRLTSVTIPDSVTSIGSSAFDRCTNLTSVTIPSSVTSIGSYAFSGCGGLTSVTIPGSVTSIGSSAFSGCGGLTSVTIPDSVTSIVDRAFSGCGGLTSVTIPGSVTSIGDGAFERCSGLANVIIPNSVTNIGTGAFVGCSGLRDVTVPQCVCANEMSLVFSSAYQSITNVVVSDGATSIGAYAFSGCTSLESVTIPDCVTNVAYNAFDSCNALKETIINMSDRDAWRINAINAYLRGRRRLIVDGEEVSRLAIPIGVTSIGDDAFHGCSGFTSVTIPDGVTSIGSSAFSGCSGLTSVAVPDSVTNIANSAFCNCTNLTSVIIPSGVTSIGASAFSGCSGLTSVTIPDSVTSIGRSAFAGCRGLTSVTIPEGAENVGDYAFRDCSSLIVAYVPEGLRGKLSANVFEGCHSDFAIFYYPYTMRDGGAASWRLDPDNLHGDDEQSLRSGAIGNEEESWLEMTVPRAGRLSFWWKASSEHDGDSVFDGAYLSIDDEPVGGLDADSYALWGVAVGGETGWTNVVLDIVGKGPHKIRWTYRKDEVDDGSVGDDCVWVSGIEFDPEPFSFAECLNDAELSVTTEGDLPWGRIQEAAQSHDGVASLRSGAIGNDQSSTLKIQVDGAGELSFWWKVSSERTVRNKRHDGCSFLVDGTEKLYMDGTTNDWQMVMVTIESDGAHELTWTYQKDASDNNEVGEDCAWLDEVVWVPHIDPIPVVALDATPDVVTNAIDFAGFADTAVKAAIGGSAAEYNAFKTWADGVKGVTGDALAGEAAVVANEHAAAAYLLGAERLFEYEPTVEIGELSIGEGENAGTTAMAVVVTVKDGEMVVAVDAEKVAAMFEATSDLGDWTGAAKLMPTVTTTGIDANGKMTFVVTPGDGTASKAFLRIRR